MNVCPGEGVAYDSYYNETDRVNILFTSLWHHVLPHMHDPQRLTYALLANYMAKCQMSSGPFGPIF